jgi:hypothetical protein
MVDAIDVATTILVRGKERVSSSGKVYTILAKHTIVVL